VEVRSIWTSTALRDYLDFPYAAQVFALRREVTPSASQKCRSETVYGVSSLPPERATPVRLLSLSRGHWTIENRLHWVRDVTFDEDRPRVRTGASAQVMVTLRNLAISFLPRGSSKVFTPAFNLRTATEWRCEMRDSSTPIRSAICFMVISSR
jgi:hypothetical protein